MKLFVGSLPFSFGDKELQELFERVGAVISAKVIMDRDTGRSRGFGFVEMADEDAKKAIEDLNGSDADGRAIVVNEARSRN
ncbi:MAG: RNA-binding protein [Waddliaceae bacterium]|jgi:cold-inducible RNA-binding protein|nr:RNA-binding protein [Waddliaceae bacterium]MBT3579557.1 RNA-binding protein [Waddliaceae bacterium]MBT4444600.1 RNA-binding protein [Waddliaceae bacterium]MBT6928760.1 RNA-binding protein [Waddliaceae bacterium]MBT7263881.1 RNA-binding protein [Waddliaceae bacterium]